MRRRAFFLVSLILLLSVAVFPQALKPQAIKGDLTKSRAPAQPLPAIHRAGPAAAPIVAEEGGTDTGERALRASSKLPLSFEPNVGQTDARVTFLSRGSGYALFLTRDGEAILRLRQPASRVGFTDPSRGHGTASATTAVLRMRLLGTNPSPARQALDELRGTSNYLIGRDSKQWRIGVPHYGQVEFRDIYPGVNLSYYGNQGQLEYDFVIAAGADPRSVRIGFEGTEALRLDRRGDLIVRVAGGSVALRAPAIYQKINGARVSIPGRYALLDGNQVGFEVGAFDAREPLVIDPILSYSTYLGGSGADAGNAIALDATGNVYVAGTTGSLDFPTSTPLQASPGGAKDAFVAKLSPSGDSLIYATYFGGSGDDSANGIAVDTAGNAYIAGHTTSADLPSLSALQPWCKLGASGQCSGDAFVAKLSADGSTLAYSTYLGGSGDDSANGIAVDSAGSAFVVGTSSSTDFPVANPLQSAAGGSDAFVARLKSDGSAMVYSTYLGGVAPTPARASPLMPPATPT